MFKPDKTIFTEGTHIRTKPHCGDAACLQGYADLCGAKLGEMVLEPLSA
jgi:hypothetical protein